MTSHRREKFGRIFENICLAVRRIASERKDIQIIYPVHPNPNIKKPAYARLQHCENIHLTAPLGYLEFLALMKSSYAVLTDSGGLQEEAPCLSVPVLVMRDNTERMEAVEAGASRLVGTDIGGIVKQTFDLLDNAGRYEKMRQAENPFGDGTAGKKIVEDLINYLEAAPGAG
jgi:UDP-N-acetylglucosamine 2-epimerase (non-hydrolysing)